MSVEGRIRELDLTIDRFSAGKSATFKQYSTMALRGEALQPEQQFTLPPNEQGDFQRIYNITITRVQLTSSLRRQKRAQFIIQTWRYIHIPLATIAVAIISFHSVVELGKMLLQFLTQR